MLERRGHSGIWPCGWNEVVVLLCQWKQWSLWAAPHPGWTVLGVVLGVLIFSPTFCCTRGNPHNLERKLLGK